MPVPVRGNTPYFIVRETLAARLTNEVLLSVSLGREVVPVWWTNEGLLSCFSREGNSVFRTDQRGNIFHFLVIDNLMQDHRSGRSARTDAAYQTLDRSWRLKNNKAVVNPIFISICLLNHTCTDQVSTSLRLSIAVSPSL